MLARLFKHQPGGLIRYYGLSEWYMSLTPEQQSALKRYFSQGMGADANWVDSGTQSSSGSSQGFLWGVGGNALRQKDYLVAEAVLLKALEVKDGNPIDRHFAYNYLIELYYKLRDDQPDAIEKCVKYCTEDIASIDAFIHASGQADCVLGISGGNVIIPRIPSFERLAIIYEDRGDLHEAIRICKQAIKLGLHDSTKGGFEGRLARIERKLANRIS